MSRQGWVVDFSLSFRPPCLLESSQEKVSRVLFIWCCGSSPQYFPPFSLCLSLIREYFFFRWVTVLFVSVAFFLGWGRCLQMKNESPHSPHQQPMIAAVWCFVCVCCKFSCSLWACCERGAEERTIPQSACCFRQSRCAFSHKGEGTSRLSDRSGLARTSLFSFFSLTFSHRLFFSFHQCIPLSLILSLWFGRSLPAPPSLFFFPASKFSLWSRG